MGGFNPPVPQQDNNWEIRVAVLLSLFFQVLILFFGPMRKRSSSQVARSAIWSCYILADWVADLALGLILNNMGNIGGNGGSSSSSGGSGTPNTGSPIIFAFWTPFLLLHLGGQDTMTAYSIQDNDLWIRHLIGLLFELFSACVIFFCSLQGNPMIPATVLMFVVGIIKYGERTYSLYSGSVDGVLAVIIGDPDPGPNYAKLMGVFNGMEKAGLDVEIVIANGEAMNAKDLLEDGKSNLRLRSLEARAYHFFNIYRKLCFDVNLSYKERMISQYFFLRGNDMTPTMAFQIVEMELDFIYDMVHTKALVAHSKAGCVLRFVSSTCIICALLIFFFHQKGGFTRVDVAITYTLLLGGMALDAATLVMLLFSNWTLVFLEEIRLAWLARAVKSLRPQLRRWREDTSQLNLISYCMGKPDPYKGGCRRCFGSPQVVRALTKVAKKLRVKEVFDDFFFIRSERLSFWEGEELLLLGYMFKWLEGKAEIRRYEEVCRYRGDGVVIHDKVFHNELVIKLTVETRHGRGQLAVAAADEAEKKEEEEVITKLVEEKLAVLTGSVQRDFDESLLLWHIATDLCFHPFPPESTAENKLTESEKCIGKTLSEYMLYLLIKQPKILLASAGIGLKRYRDTCAEARRFFESKDVWDPDHDDARKMLLSVNTSKKPAELKGDRSKSVLFDAVILAKVLRELGGDLMWEVVAQVWAEMLTYAAGKCKGSTHVQQLSRGGELITMVWFLMAHMGFSVGDVDETKPERELTPKLIVHDL